MSLVFHVQRTGRLVEQYDRRLLEHGARNGYALALAAGQGFAAFADVRPPAVGQTLRDFADTRQLGRVHDLIIRRFRPAKADIVNQRAMEQVHVLEHHRQLRHDIRRTLIAHVESAHAHRAGVHVIETGDQLRHGRLAGAGRADDGKHGTGPCGPRHIVQHRCGSGVAEANTIELDRARSRHRLGIGRFGQRSLTHDGQVVVQRLA